MLWVGQEQGSEGVCPSPFRQVVALLSKRRRFRQDARCYILHSAHTASYSVQTRVTTDCRRSRRKRTVVQSGRHGWAPRLATAFTEQDEMPNKQKRSTSKTKLHLSVSQSVRFLFAHSAPCLSFSLAQLLFLWVDRAVYTCLGRARPKQQRSGIDAKRTTEQREREACHAWP